MARSFTSKQSGQQQPEPPVEWEFKLDGVLFRVLIRSDADAVLEWSEIAEGAVSGADADSPEGAAVMARFFRLMLAPGEYPRFRAHLRQHRTSGETLIEIMQAINEEMTGAVEDETERPTQQPYRSSGGREAKDARLSKIISLREGDFEFADAPAQPERQQQRQQRQQQRRNQSRRRRAGLRPVRNATRPRLRAVPWRTAATCCISWLRSRPDSGGRGWTITSRRPRDWRSG